MKKGQTFDVCPFFISRYLLTQVSQVLKIKI